MRKLYFALLMAAVLAAPLGAQKLRIIPQETFDDGAAELAGAARALDGARKQTPNPDEKQLLLLLKASLQYAQAKLEMDRLAQAGKRAGAQERTERLMDDIESWDGRGVFYDSVFLRRGIEYRFTGPPRGQPMKKSPFGNSRVHEFKDEAAPQQRQRDEP